MVDERPSSDPGRDRGYDQRARDQVLDIYRLGIATGHATFETEPPSWKQFTTTRLLPRSG